MAKAALIVGAVRYDLDPPERQIFPERKREHLQRNAAAPQGRGQVARQQLRRGAGDEHLHVFCVTEAAYPPLPAGDILHLIQKKVLVLPCHLREHLVP